MFHSLTTEHVKFNSRRDKKTLIKIIYNKNQIVMFHQNKVFSYKTKRVTSEITDNMKYQSTSIKIYLLHKERQHHQ